jgi:hypothetical protein
MLASHGVRVVRSVDRGDTLAWGLSARRPGSLLTIFAKRSSQSCRGKHMTHDRRDSASLLWTALLRCGRGSVLQLVFRLTPSLPGRPRRAVERHVCLPSRRWRSSRDLTRVRRVLKGLIAEMHRGQAVAFVSDHRYSVRVTLGWRVRPSWLTERVRELGIELDVGVGYPRQSYVHVV